MMSNSTWPTAVARRQVWILNHYAAAPGGVGGTRHYHLGEALRAHGWNAVIIAASVELNSGKQRLKSDEKLRWDDLGGVSFLWIRVPEYVGNGGGRVWNMLAYSVRALLPSYTRGLPKPDLVIGSSVHPFAAVSGAILAMRYKVPFLFEVRDLWPQTLIDLGRLAEGNPIARAMGWIERWLYKRAQRIVTLLPHAVDYIAPMGINPAKVVWVPNGVDLSLFPVVPARAGGADGSFTVMYFGAHGQANALETIVDAMGLVRARARDRRIVLRLIGDGQSKPALVARAKERGLDEASISFEEPVPKKSIPKVAAEADAFVLSVLDRPNLYRYGISMNKLFDYLAAARPIVIASAAANNPVEDADCGFTVPPGDPMALADAILRLEALPDVEREAMGERGRRHVEDNYSYGRLAARLAGVMDDCVREWEGAR